MKLENISLQDLNPYENNPRINNKAIKSVMNSIREFGFKVPIVITKDNVIVAGHTRYKASLELGLEKVPCIIADDLTDEQIKAFRLADNKIGELADWDFEQLNIELSEIEMEMSDFGFFVADDEDFSELFNDNVDENEAEETKNKNEYKVVVYFDELDEAENLLNELKENNYNCELIK